MLLVVGFAVAALGELYFFLLQRSALLVCRASMLPPYLRFYMLPLYYRAAWLFIAGRWASVVALAFQGRWLLALALLAAYYLLLGLIPFPHDALFNIYRHELDARHGALNNCA